MKANIENITLTVMIAGFGLMGGMIHYTNTRIDKLDDKITSNLEKMDGKISLLDGRVSSIDNRLCRIEGIMSVRDFYTTRHVKEEEKK